MNVLGKRIIRAAKLDTALYEEVEKDAAALPQAMAVVVLSAIAASVGIIPKIGITGIFFVAALSLASWYAWAILAYWLGTRILPEPQTKADLGQLLRTIGFSSSPGLIRILGIIEKAQDVIFPLSAAWMLVAMVIAVKSALDYKNTWRAVIICLIGLIIQAILFALLLVISGAAKSL
jgi:hypothetical protein